MTASRDPTLFLAARRGDLDGVKEAIAKGHPVSEATACSHEQALTYKGRRYTSQALHAAAAQLTEASACQYALVVKELLDSRAHVGATCSTGGAEPCRELQAIHIAASRGDEIVLRSLLEHRADPNAKSFLDGQVHYYPIHDAAWFNQLPNVELLIEFRASVSLLNDKQSSALHIACRFGRVELAMGLIDADAEIGGGNDEGMTPLMLSVSEGCPEIVARLMERGATLDVNFLAREVLSHNLGMSGVLDAMCVPVEPKQLVLKPAMLSRMPRVELCPEGVNLEDARSYKGLLRETKVLKDRASGARLVRPAVYRCLVEQMHAFPMLRALANTPNEGALTSDAALAVVQFSWKSCYKFYMVDIAFDTMSLLCLSLLTVVLRNGKEAPVVLLVLYWLAIVKRVLEELIKVAKVDQVFPRGLSSYVANADTYREWIAIAVDVTGGYFVSHFFDNPHERAFVSLMCVLRWLRFLYMFRSFELIGLRLLPILYAISDTTVFIFIVSCSVAGATHAYYVAGLNADPSPFYAAFLTIVRLGLLGDFDLTEFAGSETRYHQEAGAGGDTWVPGDTGTDGMYETAHLVFYATALGITLVLMNILIGILGQNYDLCEDRARELFARERASTAVMYMKHSLWNPDCPRRFKTHSDAPAAGTRIWFAVQGGASRETMRSVRSTIAHHTQAAERKQAREVAALVERLEKSEARLQDQNQALAAKVDQILVLLQRGEAPTTEV